MSYSNNNNLFSKQNKQGIGQNNDQYEKRQFSLPQIHTKQNSNMGGAVSGSNLQNYNNGKNQFGNFSDPSTMDYNGNININRNIFYSNNNSVAVPNKNYIPGTNVFKNEKNYQGNNIYSNQQKAAQMFNQNDVMNVFSAVDDRQKVKQNLFKPVQVQQPQQQQQQNSNNMFLQDPQLQQQFFMMEGSRPQQQQQQQQPQMKKSNTEKHMKQKKPDSNNPLNYYHNPNNNSLNQQNYGFPPGSFYNPEEGFMIRFDYISHLPDNFCQIKIKYGVFFDMKENLLEADDLETNYIEEYSEYQRLVQKAIVTGVEAHPRVVLFIELVGLSNSSDYRTSKVWTLHYLFDETGDLISGKFKVPFYSLDYNGHMLLQEALPAVGPAQLHLRIHTARDLNLNTDKVSPPSQYVIQGLHTRDKNHQYEKLEIRKQESELQDYINNKLSESENLEILWRVDLNYLNTKKKEIKWKQQSTAFMEGNPHIKQKSGSVQNQLQNERLPSQERQQKELNLSVEDNDLGVVEEKKGNIKGKKKQQVAAIVGNQESFDRLTQPIKQFKKPRDSSVKKNNNNVSINNISSNNINNQSNLNKSVDNTAKPTSSQQGGNNAAQPNQQQAQQPAQPQKQQEPKQQQQQQQNYVPITLKLFQDETEQQKKSSQKKISVLDKKRMEEEEKKKQQQQQQLQQAEGEGDDEGNENLDKAGNNNNLKNNNDNPLKNGPAQTTTTKAAPNNPLNSNNPSANVNNNNSTINQQLASKLPANNAQGTDSLPQNAENGNESQDPNKQTLQLQVKETEEQHFERLKKQVMDKLNKKKEEQMQKQQKVQELQPKKEPISPDRTLTLKILLIQDYLDRQDLKMELILMHRQTRLKDNQGVIVYQQKLLESVPQLHAVEVNFQLQQKINPLRLKEEYGESEMMNIYFIMTFSVFVAEKNKTSKKMQEVLYAWYALPLFVRKEQHPNEPGQPMIVSKEFNMGRFSEPLWNPPVLKIPFKKNIIEEKKPFITIEIWDDKPLPPIEQENQQQLQGKPQQQQQQNTGNNNNNRQVGGQQAQPNTQQQQIGNQQGGKR